MSDGPLTQPHVSEHQYSPDEVRDYREKFRRMRRRQVVVSVFLVFSALTLIEAFSEKYFMGLPPSVVGTLSVAILVTGFLYSIWNWRCPACGFILRGAPGPRKCSRCKLPLVD